MAKKLSNEQLKKFVRKNATKFLENDNITSVGIGFKEVEGKTTKELCIQFSVGEKMELNILENLGQLIIPKSFIIDGIEIPTDVVERSYKPYETLVEEFEKVDRKKKMDPILPGASIGHPTITAGTAGCVVYEANTGEEYILSNWHVLAGEFGKIGDPIVQPGKFDDSRVDQNIAGTLINSHLGLAGDCAIAKIDSRQLEDKIIGLESIVDKIADPELGDKVIKSGRTTSVTQGIVSRIEITAKINYKGVGIERIGCFEYVPDPDNPPVDGEISMGGDSGSAVMLINRKKSTNTMMGLHFAGEVGNSPEHGLACYASSVFKKLNIVPSKAHIREFEVTKLGFNWNFLSLQVRPPYPKNKEVEKGLLKVNKKRVIHYMHFSLVMNKKRKFASWVSWNIDGGNIKKVSRKGISFKKDPDFPKGQVGNELYKSNPLDRGHIARRADLCWGTLAEAIQANKDSFYFSNMAPQHERFNQSGKAGIWGGLENAIFEGAKIEDLKVNVMGGPIFNDTKDPIYRDVKIPKEFWKVICYIDDDTNELIHHSFILTQSDLISDLEGLDLDEFEIYKVPLQRISEKIGFDFTDLEDSGTETLGSDGVIKIESLDMILN